MLIDFNSVCLTSLFVGTVVHSLLLIVLAMFDALNLLIVNALLVHVGI